MISHAPPTPAVASRGAARFPRARAGDGRERVLALQRAAGNRSVARLMRQAATETRDPLPILGIPRLPIDPSCLPRDVRIRRAEEVGPDRDLRRITLTDGSEYLVRRKRRLVVHDSFESMRPRLSTGSDDDRVWVRIDWCDGSRGDIRIGANPQQALRGIPQTIAETISNGGGAPEVLEAVANTEVTPFVSVDIARSDQWQVTGQIEVTLSRAGFGGGTGTLEVHIGPFRIGGNVTVDERGNPTGVGGTIGIGGRPARFDCSRRHRVYVQQATEYDWMPWIPPRQETGVRDVERMRPGDHYVYFPYASSAVDESRSGRAAFLDVLRQGARVTAVTGFTSPEGTRAGSGRDWQGNDRLAEERAAAAMAWARSAVGEAGAGSIATGAPEVAGSELYSPADPRPGVESSGRPLEEAVLRDFPGDPREQRHVTPEFVERMRRARTRRQRAELVYTRLRRAVISFERPVIEQEPFTRTIPGRFSEQRVLCNPVPDAQTAEHFPRSI